MDKKMRLENWRVKCKLFSALPPGHKFYEGGYIDAKCITSRIARTLWYGGSKVETVNHINSLLQEGLNLATRDPESWDIIKEEVGLFLVAIQNLIEVYKPDPLTVSRLKVVKEKIVEFCGLEIVVSET